MIPGYGSRGWCRCEYFIFALAAEMRERPNAPNRVGTHDHNYVPLYAITRDGALHMYPSGWRGEDPHKHAEAMPSRGILSNPADQANVLALEDKMIEMYGAVVVENMTQRGRNGSVVKLHNKLLRPIHMDALCKAVAKYGVKD